MAFHKTGPGLNEDKNGGPREWYSKLPLGQEPDYCVYFNDFVSEQDYAAADWTITTTEAGSGTASEALAADERYGALVITNDDADNDNDVLEHIHEVWKLDSKRLWMSARVKVSDADAVDMFMGLAVNTGGSLLTQNDRAGFQIDDGDASIIAKAEKDGTESSTDTTKDVSDDTYVKLAMYWDGKSTLKYFVDDALVATHTSNIPDDEQMAIGMMIQNGAAAAKSMTVDYIYVAQER